MDLPRPISSSRPSVNVVTLNRAKATYLKYAESKERYVGARFIIECGKKLELDSVVVCTGCLLFHQFYANASKDTEHAYDQYVSIFYFIYITLELAHGHDHILFKCAFSWLPPLAYTSRASWSRTRIS